MARARRSAASLQRPSSPTPDSASAKPVGTTEGHRLGQRNRNSCSISPSTAAGVAVEAGDVDADDDFRFPMLDCVQLRVVAHAVRGRCRRAAVQASRGQTFFTFTARPPGCSGGSDPPRAHAPCFCACGAVWVALFYIGWPLLHDPSARRLVTHAPRTHTQQYMHTGLKLNTARDPDSALQATSRSSPCVCPHAPAHTRAATRKVSSLSLQHGSIRTLAVVATLRLPLSHTRRPHQRPAGAWPAERRAQELKSSRAQELESSEPRAQRSPSSEDAELREERLDLLRQGPGRLDAHDSVGLCHGLGDWKVGLEG
jgi:hypothetical protein